MERTSDYLLGCSETPIINKDTIERVKQELKRLYESDLKDDEWDSQRVNKEKVLKVMELLSSFAVQ